MVVEYEAPEGLFYEFLYDDADDVSMYPTSPAHIEAFWVGSTFFRFSLVPETDIDR